MKQMGASIFWLFLLSILQSPLALANTESMPKEKFGISLMFDDDFLEQWCTMRDYFLKNNVKVTFYVTRLHKLNTAKKKCLSQLIQDQHEIGAHGSDHKNPKEYVAANGMAKFLIDEVEKPLALINELGIYPISYAYPWGGDTPEITKKLEHYFFIQRSTNTIHTSNIYYDWKQATMVRGAPIDIGKATWPQIQTAIENAKSKNKVLLIYGHRILEDHPKSHVTPELIHNIVELAKTMEMPFYRFSELWFKDQFQSAEPFPGKELLYSWYRSTGSLKLADHIMKNEWQVAHRFPVVTLPSPEEMTWRENPLNENYWRFIFYSLRPLKELTFAYDKTKDLKYMQKLQEVITSFLEKGTNSPLILEPHTAGFLGISLAYFYNRLKGENLLTPFIEEKLPVFLEFLGHHLQNPAHFQWDNHGVAEAMSLVMIAVNFPNLPHAFDYFQMGRTRMLQLMDKLVDKSGVQIEQSPFYHFYSLRGLWDIFTYSQKLPIFKAESFQSRIDKMVDFASYVTQPNAQVPLISSSIFYDITTPKNPIIEDIAKHYPHFQYVLTKGKKGTLPEQSSKLFVEGGFSILAGKKGWAPKLEDKMHIVFDVGPFRTNHSHFDALSVNIYGLGKTLFPDSGLYSYEKGKQFEYYSSSRAHNLVTVGKKSQIKGAAIPQTFWQSEFGDYQSGNHELYPGFITKRGVLLLKNNLIVVVDEVTPKNQINETPEEFHLYWHLDPEATAQPIAGSETNKAVQISIKNAPIATLQYCGAPMRNAESRQARGETAPLQGWFSSNYKEEVPNNVIDLKKMGTSFQVVSLIQFSKKKLPLPTCDLTWTNENVEVKIEYGLAAANTQRASYLFNIQNFSQKEEILNITSSP